MSVKLADTWGFISWDGETVNFRAPLPVLPEHPLMERDDLDEPHPPYLVAGVDWLLPGAVNVMLCDGRGWRAGVGQAETPPGYAEYIYADGDNLPPEWVEPVAKALEEIRAHWPGKTLRFRPEEDQ